MHNVFTMVNIYLALPDFLKRFTVPESNEPNSGLFFWKEHTLLYFSVSLTFCEYIFAKSASTAKKNENPHRDSNALNEINEKNVIKWMFIRERFFILTFKKSICEISRTVDALFFQKIVAACALFYQIFFQLPNQMIGRAKNKTKKSKSKRRNNMTINNN